MVKTLTAFVVSLVIVGTASAQWENRTEHDEWSGETWKSSVIGGVTTFGDSSDHYLPSIWFTNSAEVGLQLQLSNGDKQICEPVRINVLIDGKRPFREMVAERLWGLNEKSVIRIKEPGYWYERFKTADSLRVRTWDYCSNVIEMSFDITGSPTVELD